MGVGSCCSCKVGKDGAPHLLGSDLSLAGRLGDLVFVVLVDYSVTCLPQMSVQRVLGVELLKALGTSVVILLDGVSRSLRRWNSGRARHVADNLRLSSSCDQAWVVGW